MTDIHTLPQDVHIGNHAPDCVFCKILTGEIPALKLYEDDYTLALLDIRPTQPGHTLVIPKDHFENIYTLPAETACRMMMTVQKVSLAVKEAMNADGINLIMNNEAAAGQIIFHAHIHIIPRHNDDGLRHWGHKEYNEATNEAADTARKIIDELFSHDTLR
jgi:histidine triad (HIT) family protein